MTPAQTDKAAISVPGKISKERPLYITIIFIFYVLVYILDVTLCESFLLVKMNR